MTIDAMPRMSAEERAERRRKQTKLAAELKATGALDQVFARIDAGEPLSTGPDLVMRRRGELTARLRTGG